MGFDLGLQVHAVSCGGTLKINAAGGRCPRCGSTFSKARMDAVMGVREELRP